MTTTHSVTALGLSSYGETPVTASLVPYEDKPISVEYGSEASQRETRIRLLSAMQSCGVYIPRDVSVRVTVTARPPDASLDLAAAVAVARAIWKRSDPPVVVGGTPDVVFSGELSFSGEVRPTRGVFAHARELDPWRRMVSDARGAREAALLSGIRAFSARTLRDVLACDWTPAEPAPAFEPKSEPWPGERPAWADAPAVLFVGRPGSGALIKARQIAASLPPLTREEACELTAIYSLAGLLPEVPALIARRPFRAPHHTVSRAAMVGTIAPSDLQMSRPGELNLARSGVLFLDRVHEFSKATLEDVAFWGGWRVARDCASALYSPPRVVMSTSPCPCEYSGDARNICKCPPDRIRRHMDRVRTLAGLFFGPFEEVSLS